MHAWDYLTVWATWGGTGNQLRPKAVNGKTLADWETGPPLTDYICGLGEQGWELISEWYDPNSSTAAGVCWQYTWLWTDETWHNVTIGNRTYEGMQGYFEYISHLGRDRWELVSAAPQTFTVADPNERHDHSGQWLLIFKKPIDESSVTLRFKRPRPGVSS
jgi:hypothetical protein